MKQSDFDWSVLRGAALLFVFTLIVSGGLVTISYYFKEDMHGIFEQDNRHFQSQSRRYLAVDEEEQVIREYLPRFRELKRQGIIGEEHRLDWAENLRRISEHLKLSSLRYSMEPRETYTAHYTLDTGSFEVYASSMRLTMGLLHEGDLLRFLEVLDARALGKFKIGRAHV